MRAWPFGRTEKRQSYSDAVVTALLNRATGNALVTAAATAALETAAGTMARAFAAADVDGTDLLDRSLLASIGRGLVRTGDVLFVIRVDRLGKVTLALASQHEVMGSTDPAGWRYRADLSGPDGVRTVRAPAAGVVHLRYSVDPARPWIGVSPLGWASQTGTLSGAIERSLGHEAATTVGYLLPVPGDLDDEDIETFKADLRTLQGKTAVVETAADAYGAGRLAAPRREYEPQRIGPDVPESMVTLQSNTFDQVLSACGCPPDLGKSPSGANAQRESWRRYLHGTVQPLADQVGEELSTKLDRPVRLSFDRFFASDVTGRARAFQSLTGGGMEPGRAAQLTGMDEGAAS